MSSSSSTSTIQQQKLYRILLKSTGAIPWEVDLETWQFFYIDPMIESVLGYSVEEWKQPNFWANHLHTEDRDEAVRICSDATSRNEDHVFEYRMISKGGNIVWFRDSVSISTTQSGKPILQGFFFDISEGKHSELAMHTLASTGLTPNIENFYQSCVQNLTHVYSCKFAFIGLLQEDRQHVTTVAVWANGQLTDNFSYNLEGTPCKDILDQAKELIPTDASKIYSKDEMLVNMEVDSYFGAPLISSQGETIGLVSVMDTKPMYPNKQTASILGVFANRIVAETDRNASTSRLAYSQSTLTHAQHIAKLGSFEWDIEKGKVTWSKEAVLILGWPSCFSATPTLARYCDMLSLSDKAELELALNQLLIHKIPVLNEHSIKLLDGTEKFIDFRAYSYFDESRNQDIFIGTLHDVTERNKSQDALKRMANFDSLTGLPNRRLLHKKIDRTIQKSNENNESFCLALVDLDGFKEINDTLGHFAGDKLLQQLKPRFENAIRPGDYVARLGGDEFAIVFAPVKSAQEGMELTESVRKAISEPFKLEQMQVQVGASIGISIFPDHGTEAGDLLRHADVAMYQAKNKMLGYSLYDAEQDPYGPRRLALINDIKRAISNNEFVVYYQPKISTLKGSVVAVEALLRWRHPTLGLIPPAEFIPLCEVSDLIHELTDYVMLTALKDAMRWREIGLDIPVAVNISTRNLMNSSLPSRVQEALHAAKAPSNYLQLEITENDLMHDPERAKKNISALTELGIGMSIDDFGTGYSSLSYLKHLRVSELKIDKSFVSEMLLDENDMVIVKSIIEMAHNLGMSVTAEGVEDENTLSQLLSYGCETAQGFHIAKPMCGEDFLEWNA